MMVFTRVASPTISDAWFSPEAHGSASTTTSTGDEK